MTKKLFLSFLFFCGFVACQAQREKICFDYDWKFSQNDDMSNAQDVQLPHDWSISQQFNNRISGSCASLPSGMGYYTKTFTLPKSDSNRKITLLFDGIYNRSRVWINGHFLGFRPYGFCYIDYDITPYVNFGGENTVKVSVTNPSSKDSIARWYTGSGIYRHAWIVKTNPTHIKLYGNYIRTEGDKVFVTTDIEGENIEGLKLKYSVLDKNGKVVAKANANEQITINNEQLTAHTKATVKVKNPHLWSVDDPYLYTLVTKLYKGSKLIDTYTDTFGFRTAEFTSDKGFLLNGKPLKLKGFCLHQDDACLGSALPYRSMERRLEIFKQYGVNAIRCSHNQPAPEFLDICDKLGLVVIDEAFDKWKSGYYSKYFDEWWQKDLSNMIVRDRNHPSVVVWSIGNEVTEAWKADNEGVERAKMLQEFVHKLEPTRQVLVACQNNHQDKFAGVTDVVGYNYQEPRMVSDHKKFPERKFVVTEELPYYCGAEGNIRAYDTNNPWNIISSNDFIAGGFLWTGCDYVGEASLPSHGWPGGLLDISLTEKPRAMFHKAMWNPEKPMVGIAVRDNAFDQDHGRDLWQWPPMEATWNLPKSYIGLVLEVNTITNCERVVLYINGKKMGDKKTADFPNHTIVWNVPYNPGEIRACGINGNDTVARYQIRTASAPVKIDVKVDRKELKADGQDLSYITMQLLDKDGNPVQHKNLHIKGTIEGEGKLIGLINTDLRRTTPFTSQEDDTYLGRCFAIVQSTRKAGNIRLRLDIESFSEPVFLDLTSKEVKSNKNNYYNERE